jgi:enoyl-CoA hydratase
MSSQDSAPALVAEVIDSIAVIRFNRPAERNPLSVAVLEEMDRAVSDCAAQTDVSALIFTGTKGVFASGADIRELKLLDITGAEEFARRGQQLFQRIADLRPITIAAINGYCMGGALDLALACKIRIASTTTVFSHPGARLGIITGWGGTQRLARLIGRSRAIELFCTTRRISGAEALDIGLVTRVEDPVLDCALKIAREFCVQ